MVSSKYSSRRHVPQRPPICNPPLKQIQVIPPPAWPPNATRAQGSITYQGTTRTIDATITPTYPSPDSQNYYASQNGITLNYRIELAQLRIYIDYYTTTINGQYIYAAHSYRTINPAQPINESYPPWTTLYPTNANAQLTITTA